MWKAIGGKIIGMVAGGAVKKVLEKLPLGEVAKAVVEVEEAAETKMEGSRKRNIAIGILVSRVDIPYVSEENERFIWGVLIDMVVAILNRYVWKKE